MKTMKFDVKAIVSVQNRANDLWEASTDPKNHEEYVAAANRLLGALETFWAMGVIDEK